MPSAIFLRTTGVFTARHTEKSTNSYLLRDWRFVAVACKTIPVDTEILSVEKAHFAVMNIECSHECIETLKSNFKFNDAIIRFLITLRPEAVTSQAVPLLEMGEKASMSKADRAQMHEPFKAEDVYLNIAFLREFVLETGRIIPCRAAGIAVKQQRQLSRAIKWARFLALMPYCDRHS
mgnify:CR=1 FL=1